MSRKQKSVRRGRPCSVCGRWYMPNPRVGDRQRTCLREECRYTQQRRQQASWRRRNPSYWSARRLRSQLDRAESSQAEEIPRPPPPEVREIPAEVVQSAMGVQAPVILVFLLRLCDRMLQSAMEAQRDEIMEEMRRLSPAAAQSATDSSCRRP